jgi:hypothetical protein
MKKNIHTHTDTLFLWLFPKALDFIGLALVGKDIVFRFIIKYSNLREFGSCVIGVCFYMRIFER